MAKSSTTETAHSRVSTALRDALMNGDLQPGQRLVVRAIAERFQTSPMPVREALRQLVSDGALYDHPNRGVIVPDATLEVISDAVRVRCAIEGAAAEWAASTISAEELRTIERLNEEMIACSAGGEAADYLALNRAFHFAIYRAARSAMLVPIIERLWLRVGPWLNIMRGEATLGLGLDHHADALTALRAGNGGAARRAIVADIASAGDIMLRAASSGGIGEAKPRTARRKEPVAATGQDS